MSFKTRSMIALMMIIPLFSVGVKAQEVGQDVKPDHWAYEAIQDLAKKGLIKGYPPDGKFLGGRNITRYEMATIIKRVIDRMDDMVKSGPAPKGGVSQEDFDKLKSSVGEIAQMVNEFKTQLTVIGTDMEQVKKDLTDLKTQFGALSDKVNGFDNRINALTTKVDATSITVDQALENITELKTATNAALAKKVDVGVGSLRISGLLQAWYGSSFGNTLNGNFPNNFSAAPPGRSFGGGVGDTFRLRRGEIALIGKITPQADFRIMLDPAKSQNGTAAAGVLQDLWVGYQLNKHVRVEIGQQKVGLSEEGSRTSSQLLTVERSIMQGLPATSGRVGDIRDTGAVLKYAGSMGIVSAGLWNSNGATQNAVDNDRFKFGTLSAYLTAVRHITIGVWGGTNVGDYRPRNILNRFGSTVIVNYGRHMFEAEGAYTEDRNVTPGAAVLPLTLRGMGGYALYAYTMSPTWSFIGRYDTWDPAIHGGTPGGVAVPNAKHNLQEYTIGLNYFLKGHNSKIQVNYIVDDVRGGGTAFFGTRRQLLISNFQTAW